MSTKTLIIISKLSDIENLKWSGNMYKDDNLIQSVTDFILKLKNTKTQLKALQLLDLHAYGEETTPTMKDLKTFIQDAKEFSEESEKNLYK